MYNHNKIEKKWQVFWDENKTYKFTEKDNNKKFYCLDMFPYPSGKGLHVGHPKGYTATDIISRYKKLNGYDVLHPIGWDAFGLPAEQYAIETNNDPREFTEKNIINFRNQLKKLGFCFDYEKEVNTTDPSYYRWTQWIFAKLFEKGLAEIKEVEVNWCENLGTVLSNEEVLIDKNGNPVSERGNHPVSKRLMKQWVLKITKYADKLLDGLNDLDWPESLKSLQRNWIGKQEVFYIPLVINNQTKVELIAFNPNDIYNLEYIFVSPKSKILDSIILTKEQKDFISKYKDMPERYLKANKNYDGIELSINLINPITKKKIRFFVADFVAAEYNFDFICLDKNNDDHIEFCDNHDLFIEYQKEKASFEDIKQRIPCKLITKFKLNDWLFSRQRYWGEPFPIIFDEENKPHLIKESELPLLLPKINDFKPDKESLCVLNKAKEWKTININNKEYHRDLNTMPQWAGSCWYYLGYLLKQNNSYIDLNSNQAKQIFKKWLPVDLYIGGQEHAVLHLLYARFWHRFLYDINVVETKEPFQKIINQGMILGPDNEKMSKSKGNIISPDEIITTHGADTLRVYEMFMGPLTSSMAWDTDKLNGIRKWLERVYRLFTELNELGIQKIDDNTLIDNESKFEFNSMVKKISDNLEDYQFNLVVSNLMVFINHVYKSKKFYTSYMKDFLIILSLYAPHLSEELYSLLTNSNTSIFNLTWPKYDDNVLKTSLIKLPVMINKKPRDVIEVSKDETEEEVLKKALSSQKVKDYISNREITKTNVIKDKIIIIDLKE